MTGVHRVDATHYVHVKSGPIRFRPIPAFPVSPPREPGPINHGTIHAYRRRGCRCIACVAVNTAKSRVQRATVAARRAAMGSLKPARPSGKGPRLPVTPLVVAAGRVVEDGELLEVFFGVCGRTLGRWGKDGVPLYQADRAAVMLGLHPALIWPEWFDLADVDVEGEAETAALEAMAVVA